MIYIGPGKARNLAEAAKDLACQKQAVLDTVERGVVFLATGNSRLLFGKSFTGADGQQIPGIGLFDYTGEETGNVFISDVLAHPIFAPETASYGFINRTAHIHGNDRDPLFTVVKGAGDGEIARRIPRGEFVPELFRHLAVRPSSGQKSGDFKGTAPPAGRRSFPGLEYNC